MAIVEYKNKILDSIPKQNRKQNAYETVRKLIRCKVDIAKQNNSINELNDCNDKIINLLDKKEIDHNECVSLIKDVYKYAPVLKPDNDNELKEALKKYRYHIALEILNGNCTAVKFSKIKKILCSALDSIGRKF